jgi:hypothetical protein
MRVASLCLAAAVAASGVLTAGCGPRKQHVQLMAEADALFARACYSCLTRAFQTYDTLRLAGFQPAVVAKKAFDTAVLIAIREKDLGMAAEPWIAKAAALAPASGPAATRAALYLDMTRKGRWGAGRLDADEASRFERAVAAEAIAALGDWEKALGPPAARDLVGTYLMSALACAYTPPRQQDARLTIEQLAPAHRTTALMKYALGSCRAEFRDELQSLTADPDFHEAQFQIGRQRLFQGGTTVHLDAKGALAAAHKAMPEAVANSYLLAGVHLSLEEFAECAARYDDVIRHGGARRDSMLNRTKCLTRGAIRVPAIASATELIDAPGAHRGEAFYLRAWNRYHLKELPAARADIEEAKRLWVNADVFALSGFTAYDMDQKPYAYTEFGEALLLNADYCVAAFYQGLIDSTAERWAPAADRYERSTHCYSRSAAAIGRDLIRARALPADDPNRDRRIANLTEGLDAEKAQLSRAAYNTAYSFGRSGNPARGIPFAMQAITAHKEMEKLATELLEILKKAQ